MTFRLREADIVPFTSMESSTTTPYGPTVSPLLYRVERQRHPGSSNASWRKAEISEVPLLKDRSGCCRDAVSFAALHGRVGGAGLMGHRDGIHSDLCCIGDRSLSDGSQRASCLV